MKVQVLVPLTLCVSVVLLGITRIRKTEQEKENKRNRFLFTKLRVTCNVLTEYQSDKVEMQKELDKTEIEKKTLEDQVNTLQGKADKAKGDADACQGFKTSARDEAAKVESEFNNLKATTDKEIASLKAEAETLKQKLAARSQVCEFVKQDSQSASKLCNNDGIVNANKKEEPKAADTKKEEPKAEAPKKEEPKKEEPKAEEPKAEEPKKEEPKVEAPKAEAPKAEAPKAEAPKAEAPKAEAPKAEEPKKEEPKK